MHRRALLMTTLALPLALGVSACTGAAGDDDTHRPGRTATGEADQVALSITTASAWPNLHVPGAPALPDLVVFGDGRFHGSVYEAEEWELRTGVLEAADLDQLLEAAADLPGAGYGEPGLDGSITTLALGAGSGVEGDREVSVWVPSEVDGYEGRARENRVAFNEVLERAETLMRETGDPWVPQDWFLVSGDRGRHPDDPAPAPWPVTGLDPTGRIRDGLGCQVLGAPDADRVRAAQAKESLDVHGWTYAGRVVDVVLLPVIPGAECADLRSYAYPVG